MSLIFQKHANALDREYNVYYGFDEWVDFSIKNADDYIKVHTSRYAIAIPEIIVLTIYDKLPNKDIKYSRQTVFERDNCRCQYCGKTFDRKVLEVEHVFPRALGGKTEWTNIVTACRPCNSRKANRTPEQAGMRLLKKPTKPKWLSPMHKISNPDNTCQSWKHFMKNEQVLMGAET